MRELHGTSDASARSGSSVRVMQGEDEVEDIQNEDEEHEVDDKYGVRERSRDPKSREGTRTHRSQRQPIRKLFEEVKRARPRYRQRQPAEFLSDHAKNREIPARDWLDRAEGLQQDRRQHVSKSDGDFDWTDATTSILAMQADSGLQARQLPLSLAQLPQRRLCHGLR